MSDSSEIAEDLRQTIYRLNKLENGHHMLKNSLEARLGNLSLSEKPSLRSGPTKVQTMAAPLKFEHVGGIMDDDMPAEEQLRSIESYRNSITSMGANLAPLRVGGVEEEFCTCDHEDGGNKTMGISLEPKPADKDYCQDEDITTSAPMKALRVGEQEEFCQCDHKDTSTTAAPLNKIKISAKEYCQCDNTARSVNMNTLKSLRTMAAPMKAVKPAAAKVEYCQCDTQHYTTIPQHKPMEAPVEAPKASAASVAFPRTMRQIYQ